MKIRFYSAILFLLSACSPWDSEQTATRELITITETQAQSLAEKPSSVQIATQKNTQKILPYRYQNALQDPFQYRDFSKPPSAPVKKIAAAQSPTKAVLEKSAKAETSEEKNRHRLPNQPLASLAFIGTYRDTSIVALVKSPNTEVIFVQKGERLGREAAQVTAIDSNTITIKISGENGAAPIVKKVEVGQGF